MYQRDVFFFPGYDVAGIKRYHRYLKRQCGWYQRRFDVEFQVGDLTLTALDGWSVAQVTARWPEGSAKTSFYFCKWRDDVVKDYSPPPAPVCVWRMLKAVAHLAFRGQITRTARMGPNFTAALGLPVYLTILRAICLTISLLLVITGGWYIALGVLFGAGSIFGLRKLGGALYQAFFNNYLAYLERVLYQPDHGIGDQLTGAIRSVVDHGGSAALDRNELMIIGHSYGTVPAAIAAGKLTREGADVSLLTIGSIAACVALSPQDHIFRPPAEALHHSGRICWREYFAPQDSLCFSRLNMKRDFGLTVAADEKVDVKVLSARFGDFVAVRKLRKFRNNLLRMHFQFLMAVDKQGGYDFHRFALGPVGLKKASA